MLINGAVADGGGGLKALLSRRMRAIAAAPAGRQELDNGAVVDR